MEVHAHTHTPRKKWTHYFWEFLMLFLAVFCGFLAEYQLEHTIEHQREKKLIQSLVGDLKADTASFSGYINNNNKSISIFDSLFLLLENYKSGEHSANIYEYMRGGLAWRQLIFSTGTLQQLRNAGGFRLIRKQYVIDSIQQFEKECERINKLDEVIMKQQLDYRDFFGKIADARFFKYTRIYRPLGPIPDYATLAPYNQENFNQFLIKIDLIRNNLYVTSSVVLPDIRESAERLIEFLKKEYHLK